MCCAIRELPLAEHPWITLVVGTAPRRGPAARSSSRPAIACCSSPTPASSKHWRDSSRVDGFPMARLLLPVEEVVKDLTSFLRGWVGYFRYGNSARPFDKIDRYAITRLSLFMAKQHRAPTRSRAVSSRIPSRACCIAWREGQRARKVILRERRVRPRT